MKKRIPSVSDRAVEFILTREFEDLGSVTEAGIAKAIGANLSYLLRKFKKDQKISLNHFIIREKIHTAISRLDRHHQVSTVSIEELAEKLGFSETNRFTEAFKNYIGVDPLTYRDLKPGLHSPVLLS